MHPVGADGQLPGKPGTRRHAQLLKREGHQPGAHLLSRSDYGVVFAGVVKPRHAARQRVEPVGFAGHRRDDHGDFVAGRDRGGGALGSVTDAAAAFQRRAAEFLNDARHAPPPSRARRAGFRAPI